MKRKTHEHVNHERWLVSYADFITLLFAFFVVMYSSSQVDKRKVGRLAMAIQVAFQELGVFQTSSTKVPIKDDEAMPFEKVQIVENVSRDQSLGRVVNPMKGVLTSSAEAQSLQQAQQAIQNALSAEIKRREVTMSMHRDGLVVSLKEIGFFDSGSATVRPSSLDAIGRLAAVLKGRSEDLRVEGHTDNVPIHTSRFSSNWELSTARATGLVQLLITRYGLPANRLSAAGYAEFHPVASNNTADGRAQNRRLDVVILAPFQPVASAAGQARAPAGVSLEPALGSPR
jgi:chemotaxis protein MotB